MDNTITASSYLLPYWISRLIEDYQDDMEEETNWTMRLLEEDGRKAIWNLCSAMHVDTNGVPGQACFLLERYLFKRMQEFMRPGILDLEEWEDFKRSLASRIPLLMASCIQLAAKMSNVGLQMNAILVRTCLLCKGVVHSVEDIINSEFQVFSSLGFRVPLWTSLEVAQMLAVVVGLGESALEGVALMVDIAEFRRDRLTASVRDVALASPSQFGARSLGTPHLAAGAVAATVRYLACPLLDPQPRLASLTRAPLAFIKCVCDVILAEVLVDDTEVPHVVSKRKRKRSH